MNSSSTTKTGFRNPSTSIIRKTQFRDIEQGGGTTFQSKNNKTPPADDDEEESYDEEGKYYNGQNESPVIEGEEEEEEVSQHNDEEALSDESIRKITRAKNFKQKIHEYTKQKMGVHTSIVLCMIFATLFLVLISNSLSAAHIIILSLVIGFALILKEGISKTESVVAPELIAFSALWLFWFIYSYGNFAIEEDSNPFISTIIHCIFTLLFFLFPIYIMFQLIARNKLYVQYLNLIIIAQAIACIFPFYDNNAFHHLTDSLIRIICASFLYALMFYYHTMSKFEFSIHCSIIQLFYVFFGYSIISLVFFVCHFGLYIYKVLRLMYNVGTQIQENRQKKNLYNRTFQKPLPQQQQQQRPYQPEKTPQPTAAATRKNLNTQRIVSSTPQQSPMPPKNIIISKEDNDSSISDNFMSGLVT